MKTNNPDSRVMLAAIVLSVGSRAAHVAFSDVAFSLGELNDRHRKALLGCLGATRQR
jgi:hypothetical protein